MALCAPGTSGRAGGLSASLHQGIVSGLRWWQCPSLSHGLVLNWSKEFPPVTPVVLLSLRGVRAVPILQMGRLGGAKSADMGPIASGRQTEIRTHVCLTTKSMLSLKDCRPCHSPALGAFWSGNRVPQNHRLPL